MSSFPVEVAIGKAPCAIPTLYARGITLTLANDVVGTGPRLQMLMADPIANRFVEQEFFAWTEAIGLAEKLRTMRLARVADGEAFGLLTSNGRVESPVQLDLRLIEADQIASPSLNLDRPHYIDGIQFDADGNPVSYDVLRSHPGDVTFHADEVHDTVPAAAVLHYFRCDRPGQIRGIPDITPALPLFAQLRRFTLAVLAAAETAADFAGILYTDAPANGEADAAEPFEPIELEKRMLLTMPGGWKMAQMRAEQPSTTYAEFKKEILNEIARCLNMPFRPRLERTHHCPVRPPRPDHFPASLPGQMAAGREPLQCFPRQRKAVLRFRLRACPQLVRHPVAKRTADSLGTGDHRGADRLPRDLPPRGLRRARYRLRGRPSDRRGRR